MSPRGARPSERPAWLLGALAAALATFFALFVGELALRWLRPDPAAAALRAAEHRGEPVDPRSRAEVVNDLRSQGVDAVSRTVPAALLVEQPDGSLRSTLVGSDGELLPLAGISRKTVVLCNETGAFAIHRSDEHGFRNPEGLWARAPLDALLIGDSFTVGECVGPGQDLGSLLRVQLPATVNLGMSGNDPLLELATLREYGPWLRPRRVLWFYFENDLWWFDLGKQARAPLLMRYLEPGFSQRLRARQPEIDAALAELETTGADPVPEPSPIEKLEQLTPGPFGRLWSWLSLRKLRSAFGSLRAGFASPAQGADPDFELFTRILAEARDQTASWGGQLVFVYLPGVWNFDRGLLSAAADDPVRARVLEIAGSLGLRVVDLQPVLGAHEAPLSLYSYPGTSVIGPPHLNADGYRVVAAEVLEQLGL